MEDDFYNRKFPIKTTNWSLEPKKGIKKDKFSEKRFPQAPKKRIDEDLEQPFEKKPRKVNLEKTSKKLPLKNSNNKWVLPPLENEEEEENDKESLLDDNSQQLCIQDSKKKSKANILDTETNTFAEIKVEVALIASSVIENPSIEAFTKLKYLFNLQRHNDRRFARLSHATLTAIFSDILPDFYIRALTDIEKTASVGKDVAAIREYEERLVKSYSRHINNLKQDYSTIAQSGGSIEDLVIIVKCLCALIVAKPMFNFTENIIAWLIPKLNSKMTAIASAVATTFQELLLQDQVGRMSLQIVKAVSEFIKSKNYEISAIAVRTVNWVRLRSEFNHHIKGKNEEEKDKGKGGKKKASPHVHLSRRDRKERKAQKEFQKEMAEAEAVVSSEEKAKYYKETLKYLFRIYFGVLKNAANSPLLPTVLEGLAKFSHLISVEYFFDLLNTLKKLTLEKSELSFAATCQCVITVFTIAAMQENIGLDMVHFYSLFYNKMIEWPGMMGLVNIGSGMNPIIPLVHKSVDLLFFKQECSAERAAAFIHRFLSLGCHLSERHSLFCLQMASKLMERYPKARSALTESIGEAVGAGYNGEMSNPDLSCALSYSWPLLTHPNMIHGLKKTFIAAKQQMK